MFVEKKYTLFKEAGDNYLKQGDYDNAIKSYHKAILYGETNFETFYNIASAYKVINETYKAEKYYKKALRLRNDDIFALADLANIYLSVGETHKASKIINKLKPLDESLFKLFKQKLMI